MEKRSIDNALQSLAIHKIDYFRQIGSTNDAASQWLNTGAQGIYLCVAEEQLTGRGRDGRKWQTPPGSALAFSLAFSKEYLPQLNASLITGLTSLAICKTFETSFKLKPQIKWPNDILLNRKKVAGILTEASWKGEELLNLVLGIGINVASTSIAEEAHFRFPATFLEAETANSLDRVSLLASLVKSILKHYEQPGESELLTSWEERLAFKNEAVEILLSNGESFSGKLAGIDSSGRLRLTDEKRKEEFFTVGEIRQLAFVDSNNN